MFHNAVMEARSEPLGFIAGLVALALLLAGGYLLI